MEARYTGSHARYDTRYEYFMDRMRNVEIPGGSRLYLDNFEEVMRKVVSRAEDNPDNLIGLDQYVEEQLRRYSRFDAMGKGTRARYDALQYIFQALTDSRAVMFDRISHLLREDR